MFWKSLQLKLILIFLILILSILSGIGVFSIYKIEEVYYTGFVDEMLNNIRGYNFNVGEMNPKLELTPNVYGPQKNKEADIERFYNNFKIYFSLNSNTRFGTLLDSKYNDISTGKLYNLTEEAKECIAKAEASPSKYAVSDEEKLSSYLFAYVIENELLEDGKAIIIISQSKAYINKQLNQIKTMYMFAIIGTLCMTLVIAIITGNSITKPIALLTNKAELMAQGDISMVTLTDKEKAGYEITKLIDTFNLMMEQIKNNMNEISGEKNKLETILMHLTDGVLAFNTNGRLIHANYAAKKMLEFETERTFDEIFKKFEIDANLEKIIYLDDWTATDKFISINEKFLNVYFEPFRDEKDKPIGVIVVLHI